MNNPIIITELKRIAAEHRGQLKPSDVVAAARSQDSPLHSQFQWDDTAAAHQWRLEQARQLIRVTVEFVGPKDDQTLTRVFVSLTPDRQEGRGYRTTAAVLSNSEYRAQLLVDAKEEMERFQTKYAGLKELAGVFAAMRKAKAAASHKSHAA